MATHSTKFSNGFPQSRVVTMEGAVNFRDIGGYTTTTGRHVRWHRVYRSAQLNKLTDADMNVLVVRHIKTIVDMREPGEINHAPDRLPNGITMVHCAAGKINPLENWSHMLAGATSGVPFMRAFYADIHGLAPRLKPFFQALLDLPDDQALLLHCMAGKDRTGIAIALLMIALGVPHESILEDYLLTNEHGFKAMDDDVKHLHPVQLPAAVACDLLSAKQEYLHAFYGALETHHGSNEQFLTQAIGLTPEKIAQLREKFTE